jgi:ATP-dependent exoDNAse (exonuclease V) beta subunit
LGASAQDLLTFFSEDRENFFEFTAHLDVSSRFQTLYQKLKKHYEQFSPYIGRMRLDKWLRNFFVSYGFEQYLSKAEKTLWLKIFSCFQFYTFDSVEWKIIEKQLGSLVVESPTEASVEIMTIHQSKGLEFDSIYLPNLAAALPHSKSQLLYSIQTELHHLWAMLPPPSQESNTVQFCQFLTKLHREHEFVRLLYVALTRAKSSLYLSCNEEKNFGKNFKTFLEPFIFFEEQKVTFQKRVEYPDRQSMFLIPKDHVISELDWRYVSFNSEPLSIPVVSRVQERNRILGLVWHKILQYNRTWPLDTRFLAKDSLEGLFYSFGAIREDLSYLMSDFSKIYQSIKESSHGKAFFSEDYIQDEREYAFTYEKGGKLIKKIIDKFIEQPSGELRVIEVKTASLSKVPTELLLTYEKQTLFYQKYLSLLFEKPCYGSLWFLGDDRVYETKVVL